MTRHGLTPIRRAALELVADAGMNGVSFEAMARLCGVKRSTVAWLEDGALVRSGMVQFTDGTRVLRLYITKNGDAALAKFAPQAVRKR